MKTPVFVDEFFKRVNNFLPWSLPLKLVLGSILGALGGAGFLGFLSEYATYSFSIYNGFRPPLEGIPYLRATVALGSFALLITSAVVFVFSVFFVRLIVWVTVNFFEWLFKISNKSENNDETDKDIENAVRKISDRPLWQRIIYGALLSLAMSFSIDYHWFTYLLKLFDVEISLNVLTTISAVFTFYVGVVVAVLAKRSVVWWLGGIAALIYFFVWMWMLFSPNWYASFLRMVGYVGGFPIAVEFRENSDKNQQKIISGFLLLRTTEAFLLLPEGSNSILEIPRDQIRTVSHAAGGIRQLSYKLPQRSVP